MKIKIEKEHINRARLGIDEEGYEISLDLYENGQWASISSMTRDELKQLSKEIDYLLLDD